MANPFFISEMREIVDFLNLQVLEGKRAGRGRRMRKKTIRKGSKKKEGNKKTRKRKRKKRKRKWDPSEYTLWSLVHRCCFRL